MPTKPRREDVFIEVFLSAYEDLSWADCDKDRVDRHTDGGVEMLATRKSDSTTLAIEHTVAEPFAGEIEDYRVFFEPSFLKLEADKSLIVPAAGFAYPRGEKVDEPVRKRRHPDL